MYFKVTPPNYGCLELKSLLKECIEVLSFLQRDPKVMDPHSVMFDRIEGLKRRAKQQGIEI